MPENLWINDGFEEGWHHEPYNVPEVQIPDGCEFDWVEGGPNPDDPADTPFARPESNVKNRTQIPDNEEDDFFLDGQWTYKVFGAGRPVWFKVRQYHDLTAGAYTITVPTFPDLYHTKDADGNKVPAADPKSGQVRVVVDGIPSPWQLMAGDRALVLRNYAFDFTLAKSATNAAVEVEYKLPHPLKSNGIFTDGWSLVRVGDPDPDICRGAPRVQYKRLYVLLPQGYGADWWRAAVAGGQGMEWTFGSSADDAGLGDLDDRGIVAVNPSQIGTGLTQAWFDDHYPGAEIVKTIEVGTPQALQLALEKLANPDPDPDPDPPAKFTPVTLHLQTEVEGWIQFIETLCDRGTPPGAVKFVGGFESSRIVKAIDPNILTIGRYYDANQGRWLGTGDDKAAAIGYTDQFAGAIDQNPIDVISSLNETIATDNLDTIRKHVGFDVAWIPYVRQRWGGRVGSVALEVAVGNPREGQQTDMLRPVAYEVVRASEGAEIPSFVGYHSYWWGAPSASALRAAGITSFVDPADSAFSFAVPADVRPVITQPNVLRALREGDNERAAQWARWFFNATHYPGGVAAWGDAPMAIGYESGLESWWKWHAGRSLETWRPSFNAVGLDPLQLLTEIGVVGTPNRGPTLFASAGWRDSICYGGQWPVYEADLLWWQAKIRTYGDVVRAGTIFTIGDDYVGWDKFKVKKDQMDRLAQIL